MRPYLTIVILLMTGSLRAQQPFDGPYVRYAGDNLTVTNITRDDDLLIPTTVSLSAKNQVLAIVPEGHTDWAFTVKLRDSLSIDPVNYTVSGKCLFLSDIEGEFAKFREILLTAGVIDDKYNWIFGKATLVIAGDLFDRGRDVVPELWLLYKLEDEARASGGSCITLLGNHCILNLSGDHRYTDAKYFKDAWLMHTDINGLFDKDTELGRWLRTKNLIAKAGDVLVMHGGLSPALLQRNLSLAQLNSLARPYYAVPRKQIPDSLQLFFGKDALFWYRGYFMQPKATAGLVDSTLKRYGCKTIVVGHTIVKWNIASYYGGKVIGIDVDYHSGQPQGLLLNVGKWSVTDSQGKTKPLVYRPENDQVSANDIL